MDGVGVCVGVLLRLIVTYKRGLSDDTASRGYDMRLLLNIQHVDE